MKPRNFPGKKQARRERALERWKVTLVHYEQSSTYWYDRGNEEYGDRFDAKSVYAFEQISNIQRNLRLAK